MTRRALFERLRDQVWAHYFPGHDWRALEEQEVLVLQPAGITTDFLIALAILQGPAEVSAGG